MDFGSSHVYSGTGTSSPLDTRTYYSNVAEEEKKEVSNPSGLDRNNVQTYESIQDLKGQQSQGNYVLENEYDAVAFESTSQTETAWDEVPRSQQKPPVPEKPDMYKTHELVHNNSTPLSMKLRLALEERKKSLEVTEKARPEIAPKPKLPPRDTPSVAPKLETTTAPVPQEVTSKLPKKPPREKRNKKLKFDKQKSNGNATPVQEQKYEDIKPNDSSKEKSNGLSAPTKVSIPEEDTSKLPKKPPREKRNKKLKHNKPKPDSNITPVLEQKYEDIKPNDTSKEKPKSLCGPLIDFSESPAVPLLQPPLVAPKSNNCLPNTPYNPFGEIAPQDTSSLIGFVNILQPTVLNGNGAAVSCSSQLSQQQRKNDVDQSQLLTPTSTLPTTNNSKSLKTAVPNPYVMENESKIEITRNGIGDAAKSSCHADVSSNLFPCLFQSDTSSDAISNEPIETPGLKPTAPFFQGSLKRSGSNFANTVSLQNTLDACPTVNANLPSVAHKEPSAPALSASTKTRDRKREASSTSSEKSVDPAYSSAANTNIVCVKLGIIGSCEGTFHSSSPPALCSTCRAVRCDTAGAEKWECDFCQAINKSQVQAAPAASVHDVTYCAQPPTNVPGTSPESLIVFCVDISGSMCVTSKVNANSTGNHIFISRLKSLQQAISEQLNLIEATRPNCRVALVTFNDSVHLLGDGTPEQATTLSEFQLYDFDYLSHVGYVAAMPGLITTTRLQLTKAVMGLKESGGTALGPALLLSTALASKLTGSQVIVCTDGRANVGIGSLETESEYSMCHHFYEQATNMAASRGVIVSVMSIAAADCRLVQLGKIADKTAGKVNNVETSELSEEIQSILSDNVVATSVAIDLVTHRQLFFENEHGPTGCNVSQFIGNITGDSEVTFRYGVRRDEEFASLATPQQAPFQLKLMYRTLDGGMYMRVLTQMRPVTDNKELAESEMNPAVIGAHATQSAARLALEGDLETAKEVTNAHKVLVSRGKSLSTRYGNAYEVDESIYEFVQKRMDDVGTELSQADTSSECSSESSSSQIYELEQERDSATVRPPALPPRGHNSNKAQANRPTSMSSLEALISKMPSISSVRPLKAKKKRNKKKTAMEYKDKTAVKMFKFSKVTTTAFTN